MNSRQHLRSILRLSFKVFIFFEELMLLRWKEDWRDCSLRQFKIIVLEMKVAALELRMLVDSLDVDYIEMEINWWKNRYGDPMVNYYED